MSCAATSTALRALGALSLVASLSGCGFMLSLSDDGPPERQPPDSGPPVGGRDVVDWHGDAAVDPGDASADGGGFLDGDLDAGDLDAADLDAGDLDGGDLDGGDLDAGDLDAGDLDAGDPDAGELDAGELDGGFDAGPPAPGLCGTVSNLQDDFTTPPRHWWLESNGDVSVMQTAAGEIRFDVPAGSTQGTGHGRLVSRWVTSLQSENFELQFSALPGSKRLVTVLTLIGPDGPGEYLRIRYDGSGYRASVVSDSEGIDQTGTLADGTVFRFWRIRHLPDGRVRFQVSTDGTSWTSLLTHAAPSWIDSVRPVLRVEGADPNNPQAVLVDAVKGRLSSPSWCPLGALHEPFEGPLSPAWQTSALQSCDAVLDEGGLSLVQTANGNLDCSLRASSPRVHHGQTLVAKLTGWPAAALPDTFGGLHLFLGDTHELYFGVRAGTVRATVQRLDGSEATAPQMLSPVTSPQYLKLELLADGSARFSYGADGQAYTTLWTEALPDVDDVWLTLALTTFGNGDTSTTDGAVLRVEGLNAE